MSEQTLSAPSNEARMLTLFHAGVQFGLTKQGLPPEKLTPEEQERWDYGVRCGEARRKM